jgi:hypothetical protein
MTDAPRMQKTLRRVYKCTWLGCPATTERPAVDGWTYFTDCGDGIKDDGLYYCPAHADALEAILREGLDDPENGAPVS